MFLSVLSTTVKKQNYYDSTPLIKYSFTVYYWQKKCLPINEIYIYVWC